MQTSHSLYAPLVTKSEGPETTQLRDGFWRIYSDTDTSQSIQNDCTAEVGRPSSTQLRVRLNSLVHSFRLPHPHGADKVLPLSNDGNLGATRPTGGGPARSSGRGRPMSVLGN